MERCRQRFLNGWQAHLCRRYRCSRRKIARKARGYDATTPNGCNLDLTGDGKANKAFYGTPTSTRSMPRRAAPTRHQHLRAGGIAEGLKLTFDAFYTDDRKYDRSWAIRSANSPNWAAPPGAEPNIGPPAPTSSTARTSDSRVSHESVLYGAAVSGVPYDLETYSRTTSPAPSRATSISSSTTTRVAVSPVKYARSRQCPSGVHARVYAVCRRGRHLLAQRAVFLQCERRIAPPARWSIRAPIASSTPTIWQLPGAPCRMLVNMGGNVMTVQASFISDQCSEQPDGVFLEDHGVGERLQETRDSRIFRGDGHFKFTRHTDSGCDSMSAIPPTMRSSWPPRCGAAMALLRERRRTARSRNPGPNAKGCYVRYKAPTWCSIPSMRAVPAVSRSITSVITVRAPCPHKRLRRCLPRSRSTSFTTRTSRDPASECMRSIEVMDNLTPFQNSLYPGEVGITDPAISWAVGYRMDRLCAGQLQVRCLRALERNSASKSCAWIWPSISTTKAIPIPTRARRRLRGHRVDRSYNYLLPAFIWPRCHRSLQSPLRLWPQHDALDLSYWGGGVP